jgi:DNA polymerase-3 subunit beta
VESLRLSATDLEVGARVAIPARVGGKGTITVSALKLTEIVKELPAAAVTLKVQDNAAVSLRCAGATYKLVGMPPDDFPPIVPASPAAWLTVDGKTLREMLGQK